MKLKDLATLTEESGESRLVIEDRPLLDWAAGNALSPRMAQLEALEAGIIPLRYVKNFSALDIAAQTRICASRVLVCGCGGLGGTLITLLARVGVGNVATGGRGHFLRVQFEPPMALRYQHSRSAESRGRRHTRSHRQSPGRS